MKGVAISAVLLPCPRSLSTTLRPRAPLCRLAHLDPPLKTKVLARRASAFILPCRSGGQQQPSLGAEGKVARIGFFQLRGAEAGRRPPERASRRRRRRAALGFEEPRSGPHAHKPYTQHTATNTQTDSKPPHLYLAAHSRDSTGISATGPRGRESERAFEREETATEGGQAKEERRLSLSLWRGGRCPTGSRPCP